MGLVADLVEKAIVPLQLGESISDEAAEGRTHATTRHDGLHQATDKQVDIVDGIVDRRQELDGFIPTACLSTTPASTSASMSAISMMLMMMITIMMMIRASLIGVIEQLGKGGKLGQATHFTVGVVAGDAVVATTLDVEGHQIEAERCVSSTIEWISLIRNHQRRES